MFGFGDLNSDTIRKTLIEMANRAAVAGPFQVLMFYVCASMRPGGVGDPLVIAGLVALVLVMFARFGLRAVADRMIRHPRRQAWWRAGFALASVIVAITWSVLITMTYVELGLAPVAMVTHVFCTTIAAISTQAFAFEVALNLAFQVVMLIPPAVVLLTNENPMARYLGVGMAFYSLFTSYLAVNVSTGLKKALRKSEIIEEQRIALALSNGKMTAMIDSIEEVFLTFDRGGRCTSPPSTSSARLLGQDITDRHFTDLFPLSIEDRETFAAWFEYMFASPDLFETFATLGPDKSVIDGRELRVSYHAMRRGAELEAVVVTVKDVTTEWAAARRALAEQRRADLIMGAQDNPTRFRQLFDAIEDASSHLEAQNARDLNAAFFVLHTLKGQARVLGAWAVADLIHEAEVGLRREDSDLPGLVRVTNQRLITGFRAWLEAERELLTKLGVFAAPVLRLSEARLKMLEREMHADPAANALLQKFVDRLRGTEVGEALRHYGEYVKQTAARLHKAARFDVEGEPVEFDGERLKTVFGTLVHIFNNSLDHGIESPEVRAAAGKSPLGQISARYSRDGHGPRATLKLVIHDDGRGVDAAKVRASLTQKGWANVADLTDHEVIQKIFDSGVSTSAAVSSVSGLGVGLGATKAAVLAARGTIEVRSDASGTTFEIKLPLAG